MSVPTWKPVGRLMLFPRLDSSGSLLPVYTIGWRITDDADEWTRRFLRFKDGDKPHVRGGAFVLKDAVAEIIAHHGLAPDQTALTTALSSKSTKANPKSVLYRVGEWVSKKVCVSWLPDLFTKEAHRSLHSIANANDRDAEVHNKYKSGKLAGIKTLIILDDFVTRGATLGEMARALSSKNSGINVIGLALGKNESSSFAADFGVKVDNSHVPPEWETLWARGKK